MATIQDTVGRLAIAKENVTMGQKEIASLMHAIFERHDGGVEAPSRLSAGRAIERLELAIHDLKIVQERIQDG